MKRNFVIITLLCVLCWTVGWGQSVASADSLISKAPEEAEVYIIEPANGATVKSPFVAKFGLTGMGISPAGVDRPNTGHHHLLLDREELPDLTQPMQASDSLKHYGQGQTEATLSLAPGEHTLQLVLGNYQHIPHDQPVISEKIHIAVEES